MSSWRRSIKLCCKWKKFKEKIFDKIWIQPAAGDAGGALGAALAVWYLHLNNSRKISNTCKDEMQGSYLDQVLQQLR